VYTKIVTVYIGYFGARVYLGSEFKGVIFISKIKNQIAKSRNLLILSSRRGAGTQRGKDFLNV
jgi:hypothetical protein